MDQAPFDVVELQRESTADQVVGALRDVILSGRVAPGTFLRETTISQSLGVSRTTVREAVQVLVRQGLVTHEMHRGAFVTRLTADDVHDLYAVRRIVELAAVDVAVGRSDLDGLEAAVNSLSDAVEAGEMAAIVEADLQFHRSLVELLDSSRLTDLYDSVEAETRLCLLLINKAYTDPRLLVTEHGAMLEALRARDAGSARRMVEEHLADAEHGIARMLNERDGNGTGAIPSEDEEADR